jgi:capsule polysaccharide modification protein KpsS
MEATLEDIRTPALMRWSIEQCFRECKDYLGMDNYELRSWHGWRRHMLLTFNAHLFVNKLGLSYGVMTTTPGPVPVVDKPVDAQEYTEAVLSLQNNQEIKHRLEYVDHQLKNICSSFESEAKAKIEKLIQQHVSPMEG